MNSNSNEHRRSPEPADDRQGLPGSILAPFRFPAFRAIWTANLISQIGSSIQVVGAAWLMTELTRSHTLVAAVQSFNTAPILLFGLLAGAIADNFDRRRVMLISQWLMLLASVLLAGLSWAGLVGPVGLLAFTLLVGMGTAFNAPAWQASVRAQVGRSNIPQAISLNTIAVNLARSVGPAIGGVLIAATGVATGFAINALSFIAMIWVLMRWKPDAPPPERGPMFRSMREGLSFCARSRPVRRVLLRSFFVGFCAAAFQGLAPSLVRDELHGDEQILGLVLGAFGSGSIVIAVVISSVRRRFGTEKAMTGGVALYVLGIAIMASWPSLGAVLLGAALVGASFTATMTTLNVAMQMRSPEEILGRCLSIYQAVAFGSMSVGVWIWGGLADLSGIYAALIWTCVWLATSHFLLAIIAPMPAPHEGAVGPR